MELRYAEETDHPRIVRAIESWWADRPEAVRELPLVVPRLFLQHFSGTSFIVEDRTELVGFLVGFFSADQPDVAYIHFAGVAPRCRQAGLARWLYEQFFEQALRAGRAQVDCITSPGNTGSIAFHRRMGFEPAPGDSEHNGIPVHADYDGRGNGRVRFHRTLAAWP